MYEARGCVSLLHFDYTVEQITEKCGNTDRHPSHFRRQLSFGRFFGD